MRSGDVIGGRYRLEETVGEGGMGVVWQATDLELRRKVAIKRANSGDGEQIRREARIGAGLQHPNVIAVFDVVVEAGARWLIMEYMPSRSMAEILRADGPMPPSRAAHIGAQIAAALAAMHAKDMVHRDVKPGNVLIGADGTAKLTDLGIATWAAITQTGRAKSPGTPGYMAPEVVAGTPATPASDMYALGVTLAAAVEGAGPTRPDAGAPASGRDTPLADLLSALTNPNPAERPAAEKSRELLLNVASGGKKPRRRVSRPAIAAVAAVCAAVLVAAVVTTGMLTRGSEPMSGVDFVGDPRTTDPCELADEKVLAERFGPVKVDPDYGEFNRCAFLVTVGGDESNVVDVSLWLETGPEPENGVTPQTAQDGEIVVERREQTGDYCKRYIFLPERYRIAITARHVDNRPANLCTMADALVNGVSDTFNRGRLPRRPSPAPASLATVNACALLNSGDLAGPLGSGEVEPEAGFANWYCMWIADGGSRHVLVIFDRGDPISPEDGRLVKYAGRDGFVAAEGWGTTKCLAGMAFRPYTSVDQGESKLEQVRVFVRSNQPSEQRCASATALATAVAGRLPR